MRIHGPMLSLVKDVPEYNTNLTVSKRQILEAQAVPGTYWQL